MGKIKRIPINIWDDYYEDDYVPEGEIYYKNLMI